MARKRMVTRTVKEILVTVKAVNKDTDEITRVIVPVVSIVDGKKRIKCVTEALEQKNLCFMKIEGMEERETLYGMEESKFIQMAEKLPPRSKVNPETGLVEIDDQE